MWVGCYQSILYDKGVSKQGWTASFLLYGGAAIRGEYHHKVYCYFLFFICYFIYLLFILLFILFYFWRKCLVTFIWIAVHALPSLFCVLTGACGGESRHGDPQAAGEDECPEGQDSHGGQ
jgi:hypothetical protein